MPTVTKSLVWYAAGVGVNESFSFADLPKVSLAAGAIALRDSPTDYAVVVLKTPVGRRTGWLDFASADCKKGLQNTDLLTCGWPINPPKTSQNKGPGQYCASCSLTYPGGCNDQNRTTTSSDCYHTDGQEGQPAFDKKVRVVLSCHSAGVGCAARCTSQKARCNAQRLQPYAGSLKAHLGGQKHR